MKYFSTSVLLLTAIAAAQAADAPGAQLAQLPPEPLAFAEYRLTFEPHKRKDTHISLVWNYLDSANFRSLDISIPAPAHTDPLLPAQAQYVYSHTASGIKTTVTSDTHAIRLRASGKDYISITLCAGKDTTPAIDIANTISATPIPIDFDWRHPGSIGYCSANPVHEIENTVLLRNASHTEPAPFASQDQIRAYLASSKDPYEGIRTLFDRNIDPTKAALDTDYTLACMKTENGAYILVDITAPEATPQVKAWLTPTPYTGHFSMQWCDAAGNKVTAESSATFEQRGVALRLDFPMWNSSFRLVK